MRHAGQEPHRLRLRDLGVDAGAGRKFLHGEAEGDD